MERFLLILGVGLSFTLITMTAGAYYLVKMYYYMQMSENTDQLAVYIRKFFFYGVFYPLMILFFTNDMAIPLLGQPSEEQMVAYKAGELHLNLVQHNLNTGTLYLVIVFIIMITWIGYFAFNRWIKQKKAEKEKLEQENQMNQYKAQQYQNYYQNK